MVNLNRHRVVNLTGICKQTIGCAAFETIFPFALKFSFEYESLNDRLFRIPFNFSNSSVACIK